MADTETFAFFLSGDTGTTQLPWPALGSDRAALVRDTRTYWAPAIPFANVLRPEWFGAVGDGVTNDTAAVQAMWDQAVPGQRIDFTGHYLLDPIRAPVNHTWATVPYGVQFTLRSAGVLFNFNPDADPYNVEATSKSYGYLYGGTFLATPPTGSRVAMRIYGIRQMVVRDCIFGDTTTVGQFTSAIQIAFLGAHEIVKNRFLYCGTAIDCPDASDGAAGVSIPITTSTFQDNEFILNAVLSDPSGASDVPQKAFFVGGGWDRWRIMGGFCNGSGGTALDRNANFHFTNRFNGTNLLIQGVGCEQARPNSSFFLFESVTPGNFLQNIAFRDMNIDGDPAGGGHTAIEMQSCARVSLSSVRTTALTGTNKSLTMDADCAYLQVDNACRMVDPGVLNLLPSVVLDPGVDREEVIFPSRYFADPLVLAGYDGDSFSTSSHTLDMSALITGDRYPTYGVPPRGYTLLVQARDSGSPSVDRRIELGSSTLQLAQHRNIIDLSIVNPDQRVAQSIHQWANPADGSIFVDIFATGVNTLDLWIMVLAIHN